MELRKSALVEYSRDNVVDPFMPGTKVLRMCPPSPQHSALQPRS